MSPVDAGFGKNKVHHANTEPRRHNKVHHGNAEPRRHDRLCAGACLRTQAASASQPSAVKAAKDGVHHADAHLRHHRRAWRLQAHQPLAAKAAKDGVHHTDAHRHPRHHRRARRLHAHQPLAAKAAKDRVHHTDALFRHHRRA